MTIETKEHKGQPYRVCNDTWYTVGTADEVIEVIESARSAGTRIILDYGDRATGRSYDERHNVIGIVSRSMGPVKCPILIYNRRSIGGAPILTRIVIGIKTSAGKRTLYKMNQPKVGTDSAS